MQKSLRRFFNCRTTMLVAAMMLTGCSSVVRQALVAIPGDGVTVYAAGDIADCRYRFPDDSGAAQTAGLIARGLEQDARAAVLTLGDNTYPVGLPAEFSNCYAPTWGRFKARTFPSPG